MVKISANIGFLWAELPFEERIQKAAAAGFRAVECHFPYDHDPEAIASLLRETGLHMVGLNTGLGSGDTEDFGVAARPGREAEAVELIDQAIEYAARLGAGYVNVVAGKTAGAPDAEETLRQNLAYACDQAASRSLIVVIEPLSAGAVPGYHVSRVEDAVATIEAVDRPNMKLMFDCFHTQVTQGDLTNRLTANAAHLGHVQISSVPDRSEPHSGEINYRHLMATLDAIGYQGWVGAEYHPATTVEDGLGWLQEIT